MFLCVIRTLKTYSFSKCQLQLTLEQHRFELHRSTYMQIFSVNTYHSNTLSVVESADVEPRIGRDDYKVTYGFLMMGGWHP